MGSYLSRAPLSETDAANIIKKAMLYNRNRIVNAIITNGRGNVPRDMLVAYKCLYSHTDSRDYYEASADVSNEWSDRKTNRLIRQKTNYEYGRRWDECMYDTPKGYSHRLAFMCRKNGKHCYKHALMH